MATIEKRLSDLEQKAQPPGELHIVGIGDFDGEHVEADIAAARARLGPNDTLLIVEYLDDWRGDLPVA